MRVLIYEPKFVGHFLGFASVAAEAFAELGCDVTMMVPSLARETTQAKIKLANLPENVDVRFEVEVPKLYQKWENARLETAALTVALDRVPTDHLVLPSGDFVLAGLLSNGDLRRRLKSMPGVDLVMHNCQQVYPKLGIRQRTKCVLDRLAVSLARGIRLLTVDPFATSAASVSHMALIGNPVQPLPHFRDIPAHAPSQAEARLALGLPESGKFLGSIGDLGRRKGTELLIESFARSNPGDTDRLILFGLLSGTAKDVLKKHEKLIQQGKIIYRDSFVSNDDFRNFFYAMDAIWAGFPYQVGVASTQLYAAEAKRPVIASDYGAVGWLTREYGLGRTFPGKLESMSKAIAWFHGTENWHPDAEGLDRLLSYHTTENFNKHITAALRQRAPELKLNPRMLAENAS
ncbi:MAG: hypothetical protein AAGD11_16420 [Planctomycetota bacterium]